MPTYIMLMKDGTQAIVRANLGPHCSQCADVGTLLCDYPVGEGKTCDLALCQSHGYEVAPEIHYCSGHLVLWREFRQEQRDRRVLENVVPFKRSNEVPHGN